MSTQQWSVFANLVIAPYSQIPAHVQLKDQLKFARACQRLKPGDVLPSIREVARALNVGDGVVRRAYRELCEMGLLATERRKHMVATSRLAPASNADEAQAAVSQCDQLIAWADENRLSAVALGRLLLRRAIERESAFPSYVFVDICRRAAERSVAKISRMWGIKVAGMSVGDFSRNWPGNATHLSAVLVNEYLHEDVLKVAGEIAQRVFSVRVRPDERLRRRIGRLPKKSAVLLVCSDDDHPPTSEAMLRHCERLFGVTSRFQLRKTSEIPDLTTLVRARRYRLFLFSPLIWDTLSLEIRRMTTVAPAFSEPDPRSLEEVRIAAGVLL